MRIFGSYILDSRTGIIYHKPMSRLQSARTKFSRCSRTKPLELCALPDLVLRYKPAPMTNAQKRRGCKAMKVRCD
jgi:hypothetical protein